MRVEALVAVQKRMRKRVPGRIQDAFQGAIELLARDPYGPSPDMKRSWRDVWGDLPNHRHLDLPDGWRLCYTIVEAPEQEAVVRILFVGTHREYDHKYGFTPSG